MAGPGLVPPPEGVLPPAGPAPGFEVPLRANWKPQDLANFRFMDILEAKWLPEYGPDVTSKLLGTYTPACYYTTVLLSLELVHRLGPSDKPVG